MDFKEAIKARHTVRKFEDRPLETYIIEKLNSRIAGLNESLGLNMKLMVKDASAFNAALRLLLAKGARNYIILSAPEGKEEELGYASSDLMLYAQTLGLNTWWVGGTYSHAAVNEKVAGKAIGIVVVGYGKEQGKPHRSKSYDDVADYVGEAPAWFKEGVQAALDAPTAINRQAFHIHGEGNNVSITYKEAAFSKADLGIVKHHFEIGAGKENYNLI